jgi:mono/diheme cytochrome c family protein
MLKYFAAFLLVGCSTAFLGTAQQPAVKVKDVTIQQTPVTSGAQMYTTYCAACHGAKGVGDGPAVPALKIPPTDLTTLTKNNEGTFPANHVASVLRFGIENPAHGSPDMPVWGDLMKSLHPMTQDSDSQVRLRISNLTDYLKQIQK